MKRHILAGIALGLVMVFAPAVVMACGVHSGEIVLNTIVQNLVKKVK